MPVRRRLMAGRVAVRRRYVAGGAAVAVAVVGVGAAQLLPGAAPTAQAAGLVGYSDCAELLAHYRSELTRSATAYGFGSGGPMIALDDVAGSAGGAERATAAPGAVGSGPTGTNVQEQGVDEPDLVKLRDGRLVMLTGDRVRVVRAGAGPALLGSLRITGEQTSGGELLLAGDRAVALLPGWRPNKVDGPQPGATSGDDAARSMLWNPGTPTTRVLLLDLATDQPRLIEEATYDAQYVSARLTDGTVRLVTSTSPQPRVVYPVDPSAAEQERALAGNRSLAAQLSLAEILPRVVRSDSTGTVVDRGRAVACDRVFHARSPRGASTLLVTTIRPGDGLAPTDSTAVTTDGDLVYAAADRMYVATSRWGTVGPVPLLRDGGSSAPSSPATDEVSTELHGFDTSSRTATTYVGSGTVPGYVLGRWALSSYDGALRVATTRQPPWDSERAGQSSSMVVKLVERDGRLVETGRVDGLGKTEQIKAVRYFGDIAAVVTFRQTDPLYLLDLSGTPKVLGELKVPGFSTYLHPIGDGLLLALGQEADSNGRATGVQMSVFDVSDLSQPKQVDRIQLGEGWTPAMDDSRAFSYDPVNRLATFAFQSYDPAGAEGSVTSALGVTVSRDGRLREAGRLAMRPADWPQRVLIDGDLVYAVGMTGVIAGDAETLTRTGFVRFTG